MPGGQLSAAAVAQTIWICQQLSGNPVWFPPLPVNLSLMVPAWGAHEQALWTHHPCSLIATMVQGLQSALQGPRRGARELGGTQACFP